jgi:APA family basic amino acid/polyamine antiporter
VTEGPEVGGHGQLLRALSLRQTTALVIGSVIGTGIFLKAAPMTQLLEKPSLVLLAWLAAGILSLAGALTYAELGAMLPKAGGDYVYLREAYGRLPAFLSGWTSVAVIATGIIAALGTAFATFLSVFIPLDAVWIERTFHFLGEDVHWRFGIAQIVTVAIILLFSGLNTRGVALGGQIQWVLTAAKILGIAIIVVGAFLLSRQGSWANLRDPAASAAAVAAGGAATVSAFGAAMVAALWAYQGWSQMPMAAGEIDNPGRNIPRGLIYGMVIVLVVYLLTNLAYFYALPTAEILTASSTAHRDALPVATKAANSFLGTAGGKVISVLFLMSVVGALNGVTLMTSRVPFAMARDRLFFQSLGHVDPHTHVPVRAIWVQGIWGSLLALSGTFDQLTTSAIFAQWLTFGFSAAAVFVLRRKMPNAERPYRVLGYPVVPALFVLIAAWLVVNTLKTSPVESAAGLVLVAVGVPFYVYFRRTLA